MTSEPRDDGAVHILEEELARLRERLDGEARSGSAFRWNADPDDVRRAVGKLVLTLVEFVRELMERQAIRRMDRGTLSDDAVERVGLALMRLEETIHDLAGHFGLDPKELELNLGPLGRLW
jgi:hypothetical protein